MKLQKHKIKSLCINNNGPIREKLIKYYLLNEHSNYKFYVIRNMKEVEELIKIIKQTWIY